MSNFQNMQLPDSLKKSLTKMKFHNPTPIQTETIPLGLKGKDIIACAETGSGKTAAYAIPLIASLIENENLNALILCPTRELAQQTADVFRDLTYCSKKISLSTLVGGMDIRKQIKSVNKKPRVLIATPGRLLDHISRKTVSLKNTQHLVLDEGDRMLDMGFAPQLDEILKSLPQKRQTMLFTATLPKKVKALAEKYLYKPENISVGAESQPVKNIKQSMIYTSMEEKNDKLLDQLVERKGSIIIFTKTQKRTDKLASYLKEFGHQVTAIHGGRTQGQRNTALSGFRSGKFRILCATDVAARGIDIPHVQHVINYDLPMVDEDYIHRIGRTARNGAHGEALSLVSPVDERTWGFISRKFLIKTDKKVQVKTKFTAKSTLQRKKKSFTPPEHTTEADMDWLNDDTPFGTKGRSDFSRKTGKRSKTSNQKDGKSTFKDSWQDKKSFNGKNKKSKTQSRNQSKFRTKSSDAGLTWDDDKNHFEKPTRSTLYGSKLSKSGRKFKQDDYGVEDQKNRSKSKNSKSKNKDVDFEDFFETPKMKLAKKKKRQQSRSEHFFEKSSSNKNPRKNTNREQRRKRTFSATK